MRPKPNRRFVLVMLSAALVYGSPPVTAEPAGQDPLVALLQAFFRANDDSARASLARRIDAEVGGSVKTLARALQKVNLWESPDRTRGVIPLTYSDRAVIDLAYRLPADYDPGIAWPLLFCQPERGESPAETIRLADHLLGGLPGFVVVAPAHPVAAAFHETDSRRRDLHGLFRELRRAFHVDTDRVILFGRQRGGQAAWLAGIMHADLFAAALIVDAYPRLPYPEQSYRILLANLLHLPVLNLYRPLRVEVDSRRSINIIPEQHQMISTMARGESWPIITVPLQDVDIGVLPVDPNQASTVLGRRRERPPKSIAHWFRYPEHGRVAWLGQSKFAGDVWEDEQISILPAPGVDAHAFISDTLKARLAYLGGRVEGQTIHVTTRRCARIELLLPLDLVDLTQPVTVLCNGRKRHEGLLKPSTRTMLTRAYEDWEFQRPAAVQMTFKIKADSSLP